MIVYRDTDGARAIGAGLPSTAEGVRVDCEGPSTGVQTSPERRASILAPGRAHVEVCIEGQGSG
jgi:hypothetical protein